MSGTQGDRSEEGRKGSHTSGTPDWREMGDKKQDKEQDKKKEYLELRGAGVGERMEIRN